MNAVPESRPDGLAIERRARVMRGPSLRSIGLAFALGTGAFFLLPTMPPWWLPAALLVIALIPVAYRGARWRRSWVWPWLWLAVAAIFGLFCAHARTCETLCDPFPESLVRTTLIAEGRIASLPDQRGDSVRFLFRINRLTLDGAPVAYRGLARISWYQQPLPVRAGERWRLALRLKPPHGFVNPGGFDYERWLFQQGISATGYVRDDDANSRLAAEPGSYWLTRWRQRLRDRLDAALDDDGPARALVQALVLGDRGGLTPAQWEVFSRTGTSHLIAISGLHVGLVAGFVFLLARWLWSRSASLTRWLAAPRAAAVAALSAATGYAALAGFAISTQRALVMLLVVMVALMAGRTPRPASALVLALVAVLLLDPASVLSYGFWLSFGAVAILLYALGRRLSAPVVVLRWGQAQWAVALGLLPMLLLFFGRASLAAPLVNLVAVPLFGLVLPAVLLSAALALLFGWHWPLAQVGLLLEQGYGLLALISDQPVASMTLGGRPPWVWAVAVGGVLLLLAPRGLPGRWLGLVLLLPLLLMRPPTPAFGEARMTLLDVGQGLSVVVRTQSRTLVYDLGPRYPSGFETGSAVVVPYLREVGVDQVDLVMASHADQDHVGGLSGLLNGIDVERLLSGEPGELESVDRKGRASKPLSAEPCRRGQHWRWDGVDFEVLHPDGDDADYEGNNASCVLRISTAGASVLLPGDAERGVERMLVAGQGERLRADILVAGHHGSATSSASEFLAAVRPSWVLYASGYANRWGFPASEVRERVRSLGPFTANTATDGAISLVLPASGALEPPQRQREADRRIWRHGFGRSSEAANPSATAALPASAVR